MLQHFYFRHLFLSVISLFSLQNLSANNSAYEQRREAYIDTALVHPNDNTITLQAYRGVPVDTAALNNILSTAVTNGDFDFNLVKLVRVMFYTHGEYDSIILDKVNQVPLWLRKDETTRVYWSENHMVMWMGSDWLLHEKYGLPIDSALEKRLRHYLHLKVDYGFYETFSSVYTPYCLSGLLNLADFSQDTEIKTLATLAAQRLLKDLLLLTNDKGVFFPIAGRNYYGKYLSAYGQNHNNLIYLLTGMGEAPGGASHAGGFLASSTLDIDSVAASWVPNIDTSYYYGHSVDSFGAVNTGIYGEDKVIFQWSGGGYFHPILAQQTAKLLTDSNLWHHNEFAEFVSLEQVTLSSVPALAQSLNVISESSVISGKQVSIFKHGSVTLSSMHDFWKGKIGFQQFPCVANVGTTAVMTASGEVMSDWNARTADHASEHLPYVDQHKNVALIMYRPQDVPAFLNFTHKDVGLFFNDAEFDEVVNDSLWLLGRQGNGYVAVRRNCIGDVDGVRACPTNGGQTWVLMVGDSSMYGGFTQFQNIVHQSQFEEKWYIDSNSALVYYAKIHVDTTTIDYAWAVDTSTSTGINPVDGNNHALSIYPNPANNRVTIDLSAMQNQQVSIQIHNVVGQQMYVNKLSANHSNTATVNMDNWPQGVYLVDVQTPQNRYTTKLIKNE